MINNFGVGIDIINIKKFQKKSFQENERFYRKIFTDEEIDYCLKFKEPYQHFAGKFAIKEATIKSITRKIDFSNIITYHNKKKPNVKILDKNFNFKVSVSHDGEYAIAIVISEENHL